MLSEAFDAKRRSIGLPVSRSVSLDEAIARLPVRRAPTPEELAAAEDRERREQQQRARDAALYRQHRWERMLNRLGPRYARGLEGWEFHGDRSERERQFRILERVKDYAANIARNVRDGTGVVLFGPCGTGKDLMLAHLLRAACVDGGFHVEWRNGMDLFGDVRNGMDGPGPSEGALVETLSAAHVLAISDPIPPWGELTSFQAQVLFRVIDRRYRAGRPTWTTMNTKDGKEAEARISLQIVDRLRDDALCLNCEWPSFRKVAKP